MRYLESSVLAFAILFGFTIATVVFNLLSTGFFPFYLTGGLVSIIGIALFFAVRDFFRLPTRAYLTFAAAVTTSYLSYVFFNFSTNALGTSLNLANVGKTLLKFAQSQILTKVHPMFDQGNLVFLVVATVDVLVVIPLIMAYERMERRPLASMSFGDRFWAVMHDRSILINGFKYAVHGLLFQLLAAVLFIFGIFSVAGLLVLGSYFGFILGPFAGIVIAIVLAGLAFGLANSLIARLLWGIPLRFSISMFLSGLSMLLGVLCINVPVAIIPQVLVPGVSTALVTFLPAVLLDGLIGRKLAEAWAD